MSKHHLGTEDIAQHDLGIIPHEKFLVYEEPLPLGLSMGQKTTNQQTKQTKQTNRPNRPNRPNPGQDVGMQLKI
jgi:hypothetical protein